MVQVKSSKTLAKHIDAAEQGSQNEPKHPPHNLLTGRSIHNPELLLQNQRHAALNLEQLNRKMGAKSDMYFAKRFQYKSDVDLNQYFHQNEA